MEICANGVWGTVCNDRDEGKHPQGFDRNAAIVACRQLGYSEHGELIGYMVIVGSVVLLAHVIFLVRGDHKHFLR